MINIFQYMDWVVCLTTIICVELQIHRKWYAWVFSLLNQFIWLAFIICKGQYGLLPLNVVMWVQNTRGLISWLRYVKEEKRRAQSNHLSDETVSPIGETASTG